ncbi:hypothetical protein F5887DRAFT_1080341 [Amanita rubescens]|nr:hypothetical protein F5887DRAFT_1080341 [Amanita rubescens]
MNEHYKMEEAASTLSKLSQERISSDHSGIQLCEMTKARNWSDKFTAMQSSMWTWHLIHKTDPNASEEEVVFNIQGVIHRIDLPPFMEEISASSKQLRYIRQSVALTGLGTEQFGLAIKSLTDIYAFFSRFVPIDKLQPNNIVDRYGEHASIECYNRYFSMRKDLPDSKPVPFGKDIDPKGILTRVAGTTYIHADINVVRYYERIESEGNLKYKTIPPVMFRNGDIVEAQLTAMMVPMKGGTFKMMAVLHCLTLLDSSYSQESFARSIALSKMPIEVGGIGRKSILKRKIGYDEEEISSTRERLGRMDIDKNGASQ